MSPRGLVTPTARPQNSNRPCTTRRDTHGMTHDPRGPPMTNLQPVVSTATPAWQLLHECTYSYRTFKPVQPRQNQARTAASAFKHVQPRRNQARTATSAFKHVQPRWNQPRTAASASKHVQPRRNQARTAASASKHVQPLCISARTIVHTVQA